VAVLKSLAPTGSSAHPPDLQHRVHPRAREEPRPACSRSGLIALASDQAIGLCCCTCHSTSPSLSYTPQQGLRSSAIRRQAPRARKRKDRLPGRRGPCTRFEFSRLAGPATGRAQLAAWLLGRFALTCWTQHRSLHAILSALVRSRVATTHQSCPLHCPFAGLGSASLRGSIPFRAFTRESARLHPPIPLRADRRAGLAGCVTRITARPAGSHGLGRVQPFVGGHRGTHRPA